MTNVIQQLSFYFSSNLEVVHKVVSITNLQVNLFPAALTHNMTKDCSLKYKYMKITSLEHDVYIVFCFGIQNNLCIHTTCSELVIFMH